MANRTALVTGASRGIGLGLVRELLGAGVTVVATVRSSSNGLSELAASASGRLHIVTLDTSSAASIAACVEGLKKQFHHFDVSSVRCLGWLTYIWWRGRQLVPAVAGRTTRNGTPAGVKAVQQSGCSHQRE